MGIYDQLPPETLKQALKEVTGVDYDVTTDEGRARVAAKVHELLASDERDYSTELARSVVNQTLLHAAPVGGLPKVAYRLVDSDAHTEIFGEEDMPSRAVRAPSAVKDEVVSPARLGWENTEIYWTPQLATRWARFIQSAENKIPSNTGRSLSWALLQSYLSTPSFQAEQKAKNYDLVRLQTGKDRSIYHFVFGSNHIYFVVYINDSETCRAKIRDDDVTGFSNVIADAFPGRPELAKRALTHLLSALTHQ